jgi:branched-chain amino acid transport system permease protein
MRFLGTTLDAKAAVSWSGALALVVLGGALFEWLRRGFARTWGAIQEEIEQILQQREER